MTIRRCFAHAPNTKPEMILTTYRQQVSIWAQGRKSEAHSWDSMAKVNVRLDYYTDNQVLKPSGSLWHTPCSRPTDITLSLNNCLSLSSNNILYGSNTTTYDIL